MKEGRARPQRPLGFSPPSPNEATPQQRRNSGTPWLAAVMLWIHLMHLQLSSTGSHCEQMLHEEPSDKLLKEFRLASSFSAKDTPMVLLVLL